MPTTTSRVAIVGSLNIDYIAAVDHLPKPGETVPATALIQRFGGKGANQAVAAARQGARVSILGCVGKDDNGLAYRKRLHSEGIDATAVSTCDTALTGTALIAVDNGGENIIIVAAGANGQMSPAAVRRNANVIRNSQMLLLQFEIPLPAIEEAIRIAGSAGVPVVINPSPWREGFVWGKWPIDTLICNSVEAAAVFKLGSRKVFDQAVPLIQRELANWNIQNLIVTCGAEPTICVGQKESFRIPTLKVRPVDTVGAGDAFAGAYVATRAAKGSLLCAVRTANCAGALATLKRGAQESIPTRIATTRALKQLL